jgi:hypothetical protein
MAAPAPSDAHPAAWHPIDHRPPIPGPEPDRRPRPSTNSLSPSRPSPPPPSRAPGSRITRPGGSAEPPPLRPAMDRGGHLGTPLPLGSSTSECPRNREGHRCRLWMWLELRHRLLEKQPLLLPLPRRQRPPRGPWARLKKQGSSP